MTVFSLGVPRLWARQIVVAGLLSLTVLGCKRDKKDDPSPDNTVALEFQHNAPDGTTLFRRNTTYTTASGQPYKIDQLIYYVSNVKFVRADGSKWAETESYHLVKGAGASTTSPELTIKGLPEGTFTAMEFSIGVDAARNTRGDQSGALSPNEGMIWDWNTGYRFWILEGVYEPVGSIAKNLVFHIGDNPSYRTLQLPFPTPLKTGAGKTPKVHFYVDVNGLFKGVDLQDRAQREIMSGNPFAQTVANNFPAMFRVAHIHND
jgi:hypothetical protein